MEDNFDQKNISEEWKDVEDPEFKENVQSLRKNSTQAQFNGYYFYETMYNTFRIAMVCEYMDSRTNLEYLFRKRKQ